MHPHPALSPHVFQSKAFVAPNLLHLIQSDVGVHDLLQVRSVYWRYGGTLPIQIHVSQGSAIVVIHVKDQPGIEHDLALCKLQDVLHFLLCPLGEPRSPKEHLRHFAIPIEFGAIDKADQFLDRRCPVRLADAVSRYPGPGLRHTRQAALLIFLPTSAWAGNIPSDLAHDGDSMIRRFGSPQSYIDDLQIRNAFLRGYGGGTEITVTCFRYDKPYCHAK